jgi:sporulation protein YlmC with PRC-barrel domain
MKRLLTTSAIALLGLGVAACSDGSEITSTETASSQEEAADVLAANEPTDTDYYNDGTVDRDADVANAYTLAATEFEVDDLVGLDIADPTGKKIATVSDVLIGDDGKIDSIIFANGGIAGLGTDHGRIGFQDADFAIDEDGDARVIVSMDEAALETVAEWDQAKADDYSLATEITGTQVALASSDEEARVVNLIADMNGTIKHAVVTDGLTASMEGAGYVVPFSSLVVEQGDGGLRLDIDPATLKTSRVYED